jgi:hypothetical protein
VKFLHTGLWFSLLDYIYAVTIVRGWIHLVFRVYNFCFLLVKHRGHYLLCVSLSRKYNLVN